MINKVITKDGHWNFDMNSDTFSFLFISLLGKFNQKICVTAPIWQRSKAFKSHLEHLLKDYNIPYILDPKIDRAIITLPGNNRITFVPLGNGDKVRSLRPNILVLYDIEAMDQPTVQVVEHGLVATIGYPIK